MTQKEMVVVNINDYKGFIQNVLYDGKCSLTGKTESDYIKEGFDIITWEEYFPIKQKYEDAILGDWQEITEDQYYESMNVLPPLKWFDNGFYLGEMYTGNITHFYQELNDTYYTSLQRTSTPRKAILDDLREFMNQ